VGRSRAFWAAAALIVGSAASISISVTPVAAAPAIGVFVGYADSARAGGDFPNPWNGAPNLVFDGCSPQADCVFDAGAVRIRNDSATPIAIDQVSVHIGTCTYTWAGVMYPVSLAPGASLVATQRAGVEAPGCTGPDPSTFDSSDIPSQGNCTNNGIQPTIDVTIDGTTSSYTDSGQVLNTGGIDPADCSNSDESTQWVTVGSKPCPGQLLTLAPQTQTDPVGTTAAVSATLTNACGTPQADVVVVFKVGSGPNAGAMGTGVTDSAGAATFSYSSLVVGTDSLQAAVTNAVGFTRLSNAATVTWIVLFAPGGGSFVIGNENAAPGSSVYFWGSQWAKHNSLSGGPAPRSFKGFSDQPVTPACGQGWTSDPGNSTPPPDGPLPEFMGVIVTNSARQTGSEISGNTAAIVLVKIDPGYGPNPGHADTGVVVSVLCGSLSASSNNSTPQKPQRPGAPPNVNAGISAAPGGSAPSTTCQSNPPGRSNPRPSPPCIRRNRPDGWQKH
jgi:hypothetical protein